MTEPAPPLPAYVDLRNFGDMPLSVNRLRDSDIAGVSDAEVFRCAVLAWCAAWHQVPAASLPDDDAALARMVGMGRDMKGWRKVRAAGALRGFKMASDGRLYHGVIVTKACESWNSKLDFAWRRQCDRLRKENKTAKDRGEQEQPMPHKPTHISSGWACSGDDVSTGIPTEDDEGSAGIPPDLPGREGKGLEVKGGRGERAREKSTIPEDWKPKPEAVAKLKDDGYGDGEIEIQRKRFVAYHLGEGTTRASWDGSFSKWVLGDAVGKYAPREKANGGPPSNPADPWEKRVADYRADLTANKPRPFWLMEWGRPPDDQHCPAPADVLARHGFARTAA